MFCFVLFWIPFPIAIRGFIYLYLVWKFPVTFLLNREFSIKTASTIFPYILQTLNISRYNVTRYCTKRHKFRSKTSVTIRTYERHPYLALTGELWVSFVSYVEKTDREISGAHCILKHNNPKASFIKIVHVKEHNNKNFQNLTSD